MTIIINENPKFPLVLFCAYVIGIKYLMPIKRGPVVANKVKNTPDKTATNVFCLTDTIDTKAMVVTFNKIVAMILRRANWTWFHYLGTNRLTTPDPGTSKVK